MPDQDADTPTPRTGDQAPTPTSDAVAGPATVESGVWPQARSSHAPALPRSFGRFRLLEELGHGGMGVVYRALDASLEREVALKVIRGSAVDSPERRARFVREASAMARLRHPGIVEVYEISAVDDQPFFTMRLIRGETLSERIERGLVPVEEAVRIGAALARVLAYAHARGLVHRDVKPGNVMLEDGVHPVLLDFGLVQEPDADQTRYTRDSQLLGTPMYMAPELALQGPRAASPASDQYALALVLWEMMAGYHPFRAPTQLAVLRRAINEVAPSLQLAGVPASVDQVIQRALDREPAARFQDLGGLADALERALREPPPAPAPAPAPEPPPPAPRRRWLFAALALLLAVYAIPHTPYWKARDLERRAEQRWARSRAQLSKLLSQGSWEEADEQFASFARDANARESATDHEAWAWWADQLEARGRTREAVLARANAFARASSADLPAVAAPMARILREAGEWDKLTGLVSVLEERAPATLRDAEMVAIQAELRALRGDIRGALPQLAPAVQPLAAALSGATRTPVRAAVLVPWRYDAAAPAAFYSWTAKSAERTLYDARLKPLRSFTSVASLWEPQAAHALQGTELLVEQDMNSQCRLLADAGDQLRAVYQWECVNLKAALRAPNGGLLVADNRTLLQLTETAEGWEHRGAERSLNHSNSETLALESTDTDGDGQPETWVATSGWGAYDVRVIEPAGEAWRVRARRRMGEMATMAPIVYRGQPAIVAVQGYDHTKLLNLAAFGPSLPHADHQGLHILRLNEDGITRVAELPLPPLTQRARGRDNLHYAIAKFNLHVDDIDADGLDDIVVGIMDTWTYFFAQSPDGRFSQLALDGWVALATTQADADPQKEIVLRRADPTMELFLLGVGDEALPGLAFTPPPTAATPAGADPAAQWRWERAADLVRMGFTELAADRLEAIAGAYAGEAVEALSLVEAAVLWERAGRLDKAADVTARVANLPGASPETLEAAMEAFMATRRLPRALEYARARMALPDPPERVRQVRGRLEADLGGPVRVLSFGGGELPPLQVHDALAMTPDVSVQALRVRASGPGEIWRAPLRNAGSWVRIDVTATPGRIDWATGLALELRSASEVTDHWAFNWFSGGGGGYLHYRLRCPGQPLGFTYTRQELEGKRLTLSFEFDPTSALGSCTLLHGDQEMAHEVYEHAATAYGPNPDLILRTNTPGPGVSELALHEIVLQGLEPLPVTEDEAARARRLAVRGQFAEAVALLDAAGARSDADLLTRVSIYDALGQVSARHAALEALFRADPSARGVLARALLLMPDRVMPWLRGRVGDRAYILLFNVFETMATMYEDRADVQTALTEALDGLDRVQPAALATDDERARLVRALGRTGGAWRRLGRASTATRYLERACAVADEARARAGAGEDRDAMDQGYAWAAREMAVLLISSGDVDGAMAWLLRGLERSPAPELYGDMSDARGDLAALKSHPDWIRVQEARHVR